MIIMIIVLFSISITIIFSGNNPTNNYKIENVRKLEVPDAIGTPDFNRNGTEIIYNSNKYLPDEGSIWIMNIDSNMKNMLYKSKSIDTSFTSPTFSHKDNKILFCSHYLNKTTDLLEASIDILIKNGTEWTNRSLHEQIYVIHDREKNGRPLETFYSPDGKKITYQLYGGISHVGDIWIMDSNGTNHKRLTSNPGGEWKPSFSPDGSKIVYISSKGGGFPFHIWIMNSNGENKKQLTFGDWDYDEPSFLPDGRILFESSRSSPHSDKKSPGNIWLMDSDGDNHVLIIPSEFNNEVGSLYPSVNSNGTKIIFEHGLYDDDLYIVEDPTSEWKDSDGDGVWDGIDGAPDDPDAGYIKDDPLDFSPCGGVILPMSIMMVAVWSRWRMKI